MLELIGILGAIYAGYNIYEVLSADAPVVFDGRLTLYVVILGISVFALLADRLIDALGKRRRN